VAFHAGAKQAAVATAMISPETITKVSGSVALTPYSMLAVKRGRPLDSDMPAGRQALLRA